MNISADDLKTLLTAAAFVASLVSLYFTKVNWTQSNRPIISAFITEHTSGNSAATFSLVIANTGNRPAIRVRMHASHAELMSLVHQSVDPKKFQLIESNFLPQSEIPLLRNGEELSTSFGAFTRMPIDGPWLRYGAEIEISITYNDLDGRKYESRQPLKIYAREGFGGGVWASERST